MIVKSLKCLYRSPVPCYVTVWYLIFDVVTLTDILVIWSWHVYTGTCHAILIIRYLTPVLVMLYLTPDVRHRYLTCYHSFDMLSPGTRIFDLILWLLTGYYYTGHQYFFAYSWLSLLHGFDYYIVTRHLVLLNSCTLELLYSWTLGKGWLLILYSCWSP